MTFQTPSQFQNTARLIRSVAATSDAKGGITFSLGPAEAGLVYEGSVPDSQLVHCLNCDFWLLTTNDLGECHYWPPVALTPRANASFPIVPSDEWCHFWTMGQLTFRLMTGSGA